MPRLAELAQLTARWAERMNLTGHRGAEAVIRRLVLDALALASVLPRAQGVVDLGSGAGFPGLPLAILHGEWRLTLVEARARRHHFQRAAIRALGLPNVEPLLGRAETLPARPHDLVLAQAMAQPEQALVWMTRWAAPGGHLVIPCRREAPPVPLPAGIVAVAVRPYRVPLGGPERAAWVGRPEPMRNSAGRPQGPCGS